jgi:hypothetical protein
VEVTLNVFDDEVDSVRWAFRVLEYQIFPRLGDDPGPSRPDEYIAEEKLDGIAGGVAEWAATAKSIKIATIIALGSYRRSNSLLKRRITFLPGI